MAKRFTDARALPVAQGVLVGFRRLGQWQEGRLTTDEAVQLGIDLLTAAAAHGAAAALALERHAVADGGEPGGRVQLAMMAPAGPVIVWDVSAEQVTALSTLADGAALAGVSKADPPH